MKKEGVKIEETYRLLNNFLVITLWSSFYRWSMYVVFIPTGDAAETANIILFMC